MRLQFGTLDVFTETRFLGNPLAIVHLPPDSAGLTQQQKQLIAREFNFSETVFIHDPTSEEDDSPITIDIFTTQEELPFAGHPTVGSGWYLLSRRPQKNAVILRTKAGDIPVARESDGVRLKVPVDFKVHSPFAYPEFKKHQQQLNSRDFSNGVEGPEEVVSIVKGMTFMLLQMASEEALSRLQGFSERLEVPGLGEWDGLVGLYAFFERKDGIVRTRMFLGMLEDPATGSAASTLGGWLALKRGEGKWKVNIVQGLEMGRKSNIEITVEVDSRGEIREIELGGRAVKLMEGWLDI